MVGQRQLDELFDLKTPYALEPSTPSGQIVNQAGGPRALIRHHRGDEILPRCSFRDWLMEPG